MFDLFARPLIPILDALATWSGSFGIAVILLTIAVRLVLLPLGLKGLQSAARMRELQPKMQEIQERYKDNPEELQKRMMAFYREHNFNPFGGCLPTLLQFPIIVGLYRVLYDFPARLAENPELFERINMHFLFVDLTQPSPILAILAGLTTLLVMLVGPGDPTQKKMMAPMALFTLYIAWILPSGLALYITTTNLFSAAQQVFVQRSMPALRTSGTKN